MFNDMSPDDIQDTYSLYDLMERVTFRKQWFGYWTLYFGGRQETFRLPGATEDTETFHRLRMDMEMLFPYSEKQGYEAWRAECKKNYNGEFIQVYCTLQEYKRMLEVQKKLYRLFGEYYPIFAYSDNDL